MGDFLVKDSKCRPAAGIAPPRGLFYDYLEIGARFKVQARTTLGFSRSIARAFMRGSHSVRNDSAIMCSVII